MYHYICYDCRLNADPQMEHMHVLKVLFRYGIFKLLRSPGIDSKESIPPAYVAWRVGTTTLFLLEFLAPINRSKIPALGVLFLNKTALFQKRKKYALLYCNLGEVIRSRCSMFHIELSLLPLPVSVFWILHRIYIVQKAILFFICFSRYK